MQMEPHLSDTSGHRQLLELVAGKIGWVILVGMETAALIGYMACSALGELPAVQSISASTIASLLRLAVKQKRCTWGLLFCQLPAAQQLPSQQLCELRLLLWQRYGEDRAAHRPDLVMALAGLQATREMSQGAPMQFMSTLIQMSASEQQTLRAVLDDANAPEVLAAVSSQLTGDEVLQLLQQAAELGCSDTVSYLLALAPAAEIDDAEGFAFLLKAALANMVATNTWQYAVQQLPVMQQLAPDEVLSLLQVCIRQCRSSELYLSS
jgi:hypothetical protein